MMVKDRVREYRNKLKQQDCRRLDVWQRIVLIEKVRQIAQGKEESMASAVQDALEAYVAAHASADAPEDEYHALMAESRWLTEEHTRLSGVGDSHDSQREVEEYVRRLAAFNQRAARFQQSHPELVTNVPST
jgi:hypothetical protein